MKRRQPFNEIREMGYLCEGIVIEELPIQKIAECEHGSQWFEREIYAVQENPEIKDDEELVQILSAADNKPWDGYRLAKMRAGMYDVTPPKRVYNKDEIESFKKLKEKNFKALAKYETKRLIEVQKEILRIKEQRIERLRKEYNEWEKLQKIEPPKVNSPFVSSVTQKEDEFEMKDENGNTLLISKEAPQFGFIKQLADDSIAIVKPVMTFEE